MIIGNKASYPYHFTIKVNSGIPKAPWKTGGRKQNDTFLFLPMPSRFIRQAIKSPFYRNFFPIASKIDGVHLTSPAGSTSD